jgi:RecB family exonuclease
LRRSGPGGLGWATISDRPELLAELRARAWSASSLELWIACPARWFVERLLDPDSPQPDPEPLTRGGLAHAVLRDTLQGLRDRTGSARVTSARLGLARELLAAALARHEPAHQLSAEPARIPGLRRKLQADLERYLAHAAAQSSPLEPTHLELGFGFDGDPASGDEHTLADDEPACEGTRDGPQSVALPALNLGDGLRLRGRIDRIDVGPHGEAVLYDYKGANVSPAARWIEDGKIQLALYMLAVRELLGLTVVGAFYQPLTGGDLRARGALDRTAGIELDCVPTDRLEPYELEDLLDRARELARGAALQARAGAVETRPQTCTYGGGCAYPAICRRGR